MEFYKLLVWLILISLQSTLILFLAYKADGEVKYIDGVTYVTIVMILYFHILDINGQV